jgi:quercetin dioxygenase-like cupin family protein
MKTVRWFALLITATVPVSTALSATAAATPSENADAVIISQATVDGVDYITREITIQPGGSTGWHYHDGRVFGVVREGTLTRTMKDCSVVASPEGSAVTEDSGPDHTHIGRNLGPGPLVLWVDYIEPAGTRWRWTCPIPAAGKA